MIYTSTDIQRQYDAELRANAEWSVFLLPQGIPYYNSFIPPKLSPFFSEEDVLQHLSNLYHVFNNDGFTHDIGVRLMLQKEYFTSVNDYEFARLVQTVLHDWETIGFKPNVVAQSIRNPYYKFDTYNKEERKRTRLEHRRLLRLNRNLTGLESDVTIALEDFNLADGLMTFRYLYRVCDTNRYYLERLFEIRPDLKEMYDIIRTNSIKTKSYVKNRNDRNSGQS